MTAHQGSNVSTMMAVVHAAAGSSYLKPLASSTRTRRYFTASPPMPSSPNGPPCLDVKEIEVQHFANLLTVDRRAQRAQLQHARFATHAVQTLLDK